MKAFRRKRIKSDVRRKIYFDEVTGKDIKEDKDAIKSFIGASIQEEYDWLKANFNNEDFIVTFIKTYNFNHRMILEFWIGYKDISADGKYRR